MLLLKRHLVELVRAGKKRQTIRLWARPIVRPGQISFSPGLGRLRITAVDELDSLEALTEADARADGFDSLADLLTELRSIYAPPPAAKRHRYPKISRKRDQRIYRVRFEWPLPAHLQKAPASAPRNARKKSKPTRSRRKSVPAETLVVKPTRKTAGAKPAKPPARLRAGTSSGRRRALHSYILDRTPAAARTSHR